MAKSNHNFKKPGLLRAGFQYQDLVAIETLINFYRDSSLYKWVQVEAEESSFRAIEDVVACGPDGLYELTQVKFTADPHSADYTLNWRWLTARRGQSKSLLQKWAETTLLHEAQGTLAKALLKTNRIPDQSFSESLIGNRVEYSQIAEEDRALVDKQLGASNARKFFNAFEFDHSKPKLDDLEEKLWARISSDTDRGGWHRFRSRVEHWSTQNGQPEPDGKIQHFHLREAFAVERSRPLPQDFEVPESYFVPSAEFAEAFRQRVAESDGVSVLWGSPGRGKSTYLSKLVQELDEQKFVSVRHHYFLSLNDRSEGRFNYHAICQSLEHQLKEVVPDLASSKSNLGTFLAEAARALQDEGKRLIVVIDGLDHVWREHRDREEMLALFESLLPVPENAHLVVGTQKISSQHLPGRLLETLPLEEWTELPLMSRDAVGKWISYQKSNDRMNLDVAEWQSEEHVIADVANAFHEISKGLPLHLIYTFEALVLAGRPVRSDDVLQLPACPQGDIRNYYRSLWNGISSWAKSILHVLAGLEFGPPPIALVHCFGRGDDSMIALSEINHLLDRRETEVLPFHGSLFAFVKDRPLHSDEFGAHAGRVLNWLETTSPMYWRWAWLWITQAQLGDKTGLLEGPTRQWAITSIVNGYPIGQVAHILDQAELATLDAFDLCRLVELRSLKTRALEGPEFQTHEWTVFQEVALSLTEDPTLEAVTRDNLSQMHEDVFPFLVRSAHESVRDSLYEEIAAGLKHRFSLERANGLKGHNPNRKTALLKNLVCVRASGGRSFDEWAHQLFEWDDDQTNFIVPYARASRLAGVSENVLHVGERWTGPRLDREVFAALCSEGLSPTARPNLKGLSHPAMRCFALLAGETCADCLVSNDPSHLFAQDDDRQPDLACPISDAFYNIFFSVLATALEGGSAIGWSNIPQDAETSWLGRAVRELERAAMAVASKWIGSREWVSLADFYASFRLLPDSPSSFNQRSKFIGVRLALQDIAIDLCTIAIGLNATQLVQQEDMENVVASPYWSDEGWLEVFSDHRLILHTKSAAKFLAVRSSKAQQGDVTESLERTNEAIKLALFACEHGLDSLARKELERAARSLLGYGYHKDFYALEVLESLEMLARCGDSRAKETLINLAGHFEAICEYTDGDEVHYVRDRFYRAIVVHFPNRVADCYANLIEKGDWGHAEEITKEAAQADWTDTSAGQALFETFITPPDVLALEKGASPRAEQALKLVEHKTGTLPSSSEEDQADEGPGREDKEPSANSEEGSNSGPSHKDYQLGQLRELLRDASGIQDYEARRELIEEWLSFWAGEGLATEALADLQELQSERRFTFDLQGAFDRAYKISLEAQGRSKAFRWLVQAHRGARGWDRSYSSKEENLRRLREAANQYPCEWKEFIRESAKPVFPADNERNGISVGLSHLVFFLIEVGEMELAQSLALKMARVFREELSGQPIDNPNWAK